MEPLTHNRKTTGFATGCLQPGLGTRHPKKNEDSANAISNDAKKLTIKAFWRESAVIQEHQGRTPLCILRQEEIFATFNFEARARACSNA